MSLMLLVSLPFAGIGAWFGRAWTVLIPFGFWLAFGWLEAIGVLPGMSSPPALLFAGAIGAVFAGAGVAAHPRLRRRTA